MLKRTIVFIIFALISYVLYYTISYNIRMLEIAEINKKNDYGSVCFLKVPTPETKYFNIYPLKNNSILPCKYTVFNAVDRILKNVEIREKGLVPEYVKARTEANVNNISSKDYKPNLKIKNQPKNEYLTALGSGFIISNKYILTNYHLIKNAKNNILSFDTKNDIAVFNTVFNYKGRTLDAVKLFGSYELSQKNTDESIDTEVYIEGFQMHEILRLEGYLCYIDDDNLGLLFNPYKGSIYWGVASGLSGSPVIEKSTGKVIGMARSAGFYTSEEFPDEDERNTYIKIIDIDRIKSFVKKIKTDG